MSESALFRAFPALAGEIPHRTFLGGPTPVGPLSCEGLPAGVFVKDDAAATPLYGGNKPRKLEFLIGAALARRARRLVTTGGLGTHHGLATTVLGREAGLRTTLVLVDQPVTAEVRASLRLFAAWGAELRYGRNVPGAAWQVAAELARSTLRGERPVLVPTGGSSPTGVLGAVSFALELGAQVRDGQVPEPTALYVAVGSGGSLAGLVLGLRLAGLRTGAIGVLVNDILPPTPSSLARMAQRALALLRRASPEIPSVSVAPSDFDLVGRQLGAGYGAPTPAAREALARAADAGLRLETTYTAKGLAEMLARARDGALTTPALFWNTFNAIDPWADAPYEARPEAFPATLRSVAFPPGSTRPEGA